MSSESTPILSRAIIELERFIAKLGEEGKKHKILKRWTDIGVQWAIKYYVRMGNTKAYAVAMCKSFN